ncbi:MAG: PrsW family intramembrane metalloprotease [Sandaracinaceae bacterium]|nr:PrsW family intramembrane metalloprotease [Sandaracinaceae bacterium]
MAGKAKWPDPYRTRKIVGLVLWLLSVLLGVFGFATAVIFQSIASPFPGKMFFGIAEGALFAFPASLFYFLVARFLDRYDPEPLWAVLMCFIWGASIACAISFWINSIIAGVVLGIFQNPELAQAIAAIFSAPFIEESSKSIMILGMSYFAREEFDGAIDGVIYAIFVAIGFAAAENVFYYGGAIVMPEPFDFESVFFARGVLTPWAHPLFTSMVGLGIGYGREKGGVFPTIGGAFLGWLVAVFLHMGWNFMAIVIGASDKSITGLLFLAIALGVWAWILFFFALLVLYLVRRRGKILKQYLQDEVMLGHITQRELELVTSAFGTMSAFLKKGKKGVEFLRAIARLGLMKWRAARAMQNKALTFAGDFILPLRERIRGLRAEGASPTE